MCTVKSVGRTNIVIDDELVAKVKELYGFETTREVVDFALRRLVGNGSRGGVPQAAGHWLGRRPRRDAPDSVPRLVVLETSAIIEYLRGTGSAVDRTVDEYLEDASIELAITEVVLMELLAGGRDEVNAADLGDQLAQFTMLRLDPLQGFEDAAAIYRAARRRGLTIRKMTDCLIAVPVVKAGASLLHADADFDRIAQVAPLRIEPLRP